MIRTDGGKVTPAVRRAVRNKGQQDTPVKNVGTLEAVKGGAGGAVDRGWVRLAVCAQADAAGGRRVVTGGTRCAGGRLRPKPELVGHTQVRKVDCGVPRERRRPVGVW